MQNYNPGLEGVVIAHTEISFIDGKAGRLLYRGYDIHDLVRASYEEVVYLLWHGNLPDAAALAAFKRSLAAERALPGALIDMIRRFPKTASPMETLRTALSALSVHDPEANVVAEAANLRKAVILTSKAASVVAALARAREDKPVVEPDGALDHAANFLYMLFGAPADEQATKAMDCSLILHADHEMNASTFAARVTVATLSDMYSGVTSAVGALKGPLHGGANEAVMRMLVEIGEPGRVAAWLRSALAARKVLPGFGHRLYTTEDPRSRHLRALAAGLRARDGVAKWYAVACELEEAMNKETGTYPNVDYWAAVTWHALGIATDFFTPVFAMSRVAGWSAHLFEQYAHNHIYRPEGEYVGPLGRTFVPLAERRGPA